MILSSRRPPTRTARFRTAVTNANGHLHVSFLDGAQRVSAVEERIEGRVPTTRYLYDPVAQLQKYLDAKDTNSTNGGAFNPHHLSLYEYSYHTPVVPKESGRTVPALHRRRRRRRR